MVLNTSHLNGKLTETIFQEALKHTTSSFGSLMDESFSEIKTAYTVVQNILLLETLISEQLYTQSLF